MKKKYSTISSFKVLIIVIIILLISFSIIAAWLIKQPYSPSKEKWIRQIDVYLILDYSQVERMNFNSSNEQLKEFGFSSSNQSKKNIDYHEYWFGIPSNSGYDLLDIRIIGNASLHNTNAWMNVWYSSSFSEKELENNKNLMISNVNIVAQKCNLTINWINAQWDIIYQD